MDLLTVCDVRADFCKIADAAMECLWDSPYRALRRVSCECKDGILVLTGRLSSFHEKQVAQEAVVRVEGTMQVVNEIEVD